MSSISRTITLKPRLSEKTYGLSQANNVYVFEVPKSANKHEVAKAVTVQFEVTVETVNIINLKGKAIRSFRKGGKSTRGKRSDIKKAYVTLSGGNSLPFFEAQEESEKKAEKAEAKAAKKAPVVEDKTEEPPKARRGFRRAK